MFTQSHRTIAAMSVVAASLAFAPGAAAQSECEPVFDFTFEAAPGATLTWDALLLCNDAEPAGEFTFQVSVANSEESSATVTLSDLEALFFFPEDAAGATGDFPLIIAPGESASFSVTGTFSLTGDEQLSLANLAFQAIGMTDAGAPVHVPFFALFRPTGDLAGGDPPALLADEPDVPPIGDGVVDGVDLGALLSEFGTVCPTEEDAPCPADLNGDGVIDGADLGMLLGAWG